MRSPRSGSRTTARWNPRRAAIWTGLMVGSLMPTVGCQVEYAGMTLPSGKYMRDDVQYFPPGPDFPWANTQAATQRERMRSMGIEPIGSGVNGQMPPVPSDLNLGAPYGNMPPAGGAAAPAAGQPIAVPAPAAPQGAKVPPPPPPGDAAPAPDN
ncbi:MAG: hypothetical protein KGM43_00025 [Planctomycetota bacterium]|nr:hypothetical protein [Planctomycetota bacterium]